jgi:hypothetical protein
LRHERRTAGQSEGPLIHPSREALAERSVSILPRISPGNEYHGLYANAHRGKIKKTDRVPLALGMIEKEAGPVPSKGWAEMIRKVYEVDPLT